MYSRKRVLITARIGFAVASAIGGAAVSFVMLVAARALQGASGAILAPGRAPCWPAPGCSSSSLASPALRQPAGPPC
jgi:MFS family permease